MAFRTGRSQSAWLFHLGCDLLALNVDVLLMDASRPSRTLSISPRWYADFRGCRNERVDLRYQAFLTAAGGVHPVPGEDLGQ